MSEGWKPIPNTAHSYYRVDERGRPCYRFDSEGVKTVREFDERIFADGWRWRETTQLDTGEVFGAYYPPRFEAAS